MMISLATVGFFVYFFWRYAYKPRAGVDYVDIKFLKSKTPIEAKQNELIHIPVLITSRDNTKKISGIDLSFKFDSDNKDLIDFNSWFSQKYGGDGAPYFDEEVLKEIKTKDGAKILRLVLVKKGDDSLLGFNILLELIFKAKTKKGNTFVGLMNDQNQISGTATGNFFAISYDDSYSNILINENANCQSNNDCGGQNGNSNCNNSQCECKVGYYNCDGNWNNGCESTQVCSAISPTNTPTPTETPTPTLTPTRTPTPAPTGTVTLNLKLKFQGIRQKPADSRNNMAVKITVVSANNQRKEATANFTAQNENNIAVWSGTVSFNIQPGNGYRILVKGPKHIQKKICDQNPSETADGTYRCFEGKINLSAGQNNLNFSQITLLSGDLPVQDGVVNSYDTSLIRNCLNKNDQTCLTNADINLDGAVNAMDYSLVIAALSIKTDEE